MPDQTAYKYTIDAQDRIVRVDDNWLRFARDNGAPELTAERVIGTPLWESIEGDELSALYRHLLHVVRSKRQELMLPFRCDSPDVIRHMVMTLRSVNGGQIDFENHLLRVEKREPVRWPSAPAETSPPENIPICGLCRRVFLEGKWVELTRGVVMARMASNSVPPHVKESLCEVCARLAPCAAPPRGSGS